MVRIRDKNQVLLCKWTRRCDMEEDIFWMSTIDARYELGNARG